MMQNSVIIVHNIPPWYIYNIIFIYIYNKTSECFVILHTPTLFNLVIIEIVVVVVGTASIALVVVCGSSHNGIQLCTQPICTYIHTFKCMHHSNTVMYAAFNSA